MLHEFLSSNRDELIRRCRSKVGKRDSPPVTRAELDHGVPLFLEQLVWALRCERESPGLDRDRIYGPLSKTPAAVESSRTAGLHGNDLLEAGYSVGQVVHDYGDICQAVTELAQEKNAPVTIDEFRTFNRLLDNAIADAVSSYGRHRDESASARWNEQRKLVETALTALAALKLGNVGLMAITGTLLEDSLKKLRDLISSALPEARLSAGMITPSKP